MLEEEVECKDGLLVIAKEEYDKIVTEEVCSAVYESAIVSKKSKAELDAEYKHRTNVIENVISSSVCLQRFYFIIRSSVIGLITGLLTYAVISIFFVTNFFELMVLGVIVFVGSLVFSRVFDKTIIKISSAAVLYLKKHQRLRSLILKRL
jgi:cytochrome c biogenesis protein CcdA